MNDNPNWRRRLRHALEEHFRQRGYPRLTLGLILLTTGCAGFGISVGLLFLGMGDMWLRYPIAVVGAYVVFLILMRIWVELEKTRFNPDDLVIPEHAPHEPVFTEQKNSWLDYLDLPDLSFDEGCLPVLLIGVVVGLVVLLFTAIAGAPVLLAEVFIDAFLAGVLYRRLKIAAREHWLGTAIRKTWLIVLATAALLGIGGWVLSVMAPGTRTVGSAVEELLKKPD